MCIILMSVLLTLATFLVGICLGIGIKHLVYYVSDKLGEYYKKHDKNNLIT